MLKMQNCGYFFESHPGDTTWVATCCANRAYADQQKLKHFQDTFKYLYKFSTVCLLLDIITCFCCVMLSSADLLISLLQ
jgi:hypothetical protein